MEIFGGFMVMMSILGLFLAVVWLVMPFVVFSIKGRQDRTLEVLESMEKRLKSIEEQLAEARNASTRLDAAAPPDAGQPAQEQAAEHPPALP